LAARPPCDLFRRSRAIAWPCHSCRRPCRERHTWKANDSLFPRLFRSDNFAFNPPQWPRAAFARARNGFSDSRHFCRTDAKFDDRRLAKAAGASEQRWARSWSLPAPAVTRWNRTLLPGSSCPRFQEL